MTDPETKVRSFLLVVLVVVGTIPAATVAPVAAAAAGNDAGNTSGDGASNAPDTFHVQQAGQCYEVGALGGGTESVEDFYDYRSPETDPSSPKYASFGTTHLQDNQQSKLLVYNGSEGYSLVVLHDAMSEDDGGAPYGSTVTFQLSGVGDSSWAVQDDYYEDGNQDDNWDTAGNTHEIDWMWSGDRNDGGALHGIAGETITIDPGFNEDAEEWGSWDYSGDEQNRTEGWAVIDGAGEDRTELSLNMTESVTVKTGTCSDGSSPNADLTASPNPAANDEAVTLDASGSTDDDDISEYHWDFDGDGQVDEQTTDATVTHAYDESGDYEAAVTVVDETHKQDTASTTVEVVNSSEPVVTVNAPDEVAAGHEFEVSADPRKDRTIESYEWDFDGTTKSGQQVTHTYSETGNYTATLSWTADNGDTGTETVTIEAKVGTITYVNASAIEVTGEFEEVMIDTTWYSTAGLAGETVPLDNVSGTTTYQAPDAGINGSAIAHVGADKDTGDGEFDLDKQNPLDYDVRPEPVNVSVESVTETGDGVYEVTFSYVNPNDGKLLPSKSQFTTGNVDGEPPATLYPGENTTTVTWTPDSNDERVTWTVNQSNFDRADASASTEAASEYDDGGDGGDDPPKDGGPTAKLSVDAGPVDLYDEVEFDASGSTDDGKVVKYKWDFDGDGKVERTTPDDATEGNKDNDAHTVHHAAYSVFDGEGTYHPEVTVVYDDESTDTASATITVERHDHKAPNATLDVPDEVTVDEKFTVEATNFTEPESRLSYVNWKFSDGVHNETPTGPVANHTFEETGEKKVQFQVSDYAGNKNVLNRTIEVTKADDESDDHDDSPEHGDDPFEDPDNRDSRSGGIPGANPDDEQSDDERPLDDAPRNVSENLTDDDGRFGTVVVTADDGSEVTVEVYDTAPSGIPAPTPARDGFEAVSFLTADGADRTTVTVASARLDRLDATPEDVSLFRYENGTWTAVETTVANATGDTYQFRANVTNGTYAVGVERPVIGVTDVNVQNRTVAPGEAATVAVTVENAGLANGTDEVTLAVGGDAVATETVSLSAGGWTTLRFAPTFASAGTYEVTVGDATAEIVVESVETETTTTTSPEDPATETTTTTDESTGSIPGFGVGVALVALLASALLALRRR